MSFPYLKPTELQVNDNIWASKTISQMSAGKGNAAYLISSVKLLFREEEILVHFEIILNIDESN